MNPFTRFFTAMQQRAPAAGLRSWLQGWAAEPLWGLGALAGGYALGYTGWALTHRPLLTAALQQANPQLTPAQALELLGWLVVGSVLVLAGWIFFYLRTAGAQGAGAQGGQPRWKAGARAAAGCLLLLPLLYSTWYQWHFVGQAAGLAAVVLGAALVAVGGVALFADAARALFARVDSPKVAGRLMLLASLLFVGLLTVAGVARHLSFNSAAHDMGIHVQLAWSTLQGRWFETSLLGAQPQNYMVNHFSPSLLLIYPFYAIAPTPETLVVLQALLMGATALVLYDLVRRVQGSPHIALATTGAFLLHPLMHQGMLFDFHQDALAAFFLAVGLWAVVAGRFRLVALMWLLGIFAKEDVTLFWAFFALFQAVQQPKARGAWLAFAIANIVAMALMLLLLSPLFARPDEIYPSLILRYSALGDRPLTMLFTLLFQPLFLFRLLTQPLRMWSLLLLVLPWLAALVGGRRAGPWLLLAPLAVNALSSFDLQSGFQLHYAMLPLVALVVASAYALERAHSTRLLSSIAGFTLLSALLLGLLISPLGLLQGPATVARFRPDSHDRLGRDFLTALPSDAYVVAQQALVPHITHRRAITFYPRRLVGGPPDYILLDVTSDPWPLGPAEYHSSVKRLLDDPTFGVRRVEDGFVLLQRGAPRGLVAEARALLAARGPTLP